MTGLELSRGYFEDCGKPMLDAEFPALWAYIAVGLVGSGSERYGFDDERSRDHDFEPGFCIFLPDEDVVDRRTAFLLERAYAKLPAEYGGVRRAKLAPVGGSRNGVLRTADFYRKAVGAPDGKLTLSQWLTTPDYALAEAVNGEVFYDGYGEFSEIRSRLMQMPQDVWKKRLAGNLLLMAQAGAYNFARCLAHGEPEAAQLAATEFVNAALKTLFLLHGRYMPYYKWSFRALRQFDPGNAARLSVLLRGDNRDSGDARRKQEAIDKISADVIDRLRARGLSGEMSDDLEKHAYRVNDTIEDGEIRNLHILAAV